MSARSLASMRAIVVACALAVALQSSAALGAFGSSAYIPSPDYNNVLPGKPLPKLPYASAVSLDGDPLDIYSVTMQGGSDYTFQVSRHTTDVNLRVRLYGPGTTSLDSVPLITVMNPSVGPVTVLTHAAGTHYLVVEATSGSGSYRVWGWTPRNVHPGIALPEELENIWKDMPNLQGSVDATNDYYDIYSAELKAAKKYTFSAVRTGGSSEVGLGTPKLSVAVYPIGTKDFLRATPLATGTDTKVAVATVTPPTAGKYIIVVRGVLGVSAYRLTAPSSDLTMERDSFPFENYMGATDLDIFRSTYGLPAGSALTPKAQEYYDYPYSYSFGHGQCYGLAVLAPMIHRGIWRAPGTYSSTAKSVRELKRTTKGGENFSADYNYARDIDEPLERDIAKFFWYQMDPLIRTKMLRTNGASFGSLALPIQNEILSNAYKDPYVLGFWWGGSGHAVTVTGVNGIFDAGNGWLSIYDNNNAEGYGKIGVRSSGTSHWLDMYDEGTMTGWFEVMVVPTSVHEKSSIAPPWNGWFSYWVSALGDPATSESIVRDSRGRRLGSSGTTRFTEIPGASRVDVLGGLKKAPPTPIQYYLPKDADYSVEFKRKTAGPLDYRLFAGEMLMKAEIPQSAAGIRNRLRTQRLSKGFGFSSDSTPPIDVKLHLMREPGGKPRVFTFSRLKTGASAVTTITSALDANTVNLRSTRQQDYELTLKSFTGTSTVSTVVTATAPLGKTQSVQVWDWNRLRTAPLFLITSTAPGKETIAVRQTGALSAAQFTTELRTRGLLTPTLATEVGGKLSLNQTSLRTYLGGLATQGRLSKRTAGLLYAYTIAKRLPAGQTAPPISISGN